MIKRKKKNRINMRKVITMVTIQFVIALFFGCMLQGSMPIALEKTKPATITVDAVQYIRSGEGYLIISSNSDTYIFDNSGYPEQYGVRKLRDMITAGETLSIRYTKSWMLSLGIHNRIVDARTESEILRSMEIYNEGVKNHPFYTSIFWGFIELVFLFVVFLMVRRKSFFRN